MSGNEPHIQATGGIKIGGGGCRAEHTRGRPKVIAEVKELARAHTGEAIETLVSIMTNPQAAPAARVSAANALLDRGYGKPPQHITGENGPSYVARLPVPCKTAEEWVAKSPRIGQHRLMVRLLRQRSRSRGSV